MIDDQNTNSDDVNVAEASGMGEVDESAMQINGGDGLPFETGEEPASATDEGASGSEKSAPGEESPEEGEQSTEGQNSEESEGRRKRTVPYSKLKEERQKRQEAEDERKNLETAVAQERSELRGAITELTNAIASIKSNEDTGEDEAGTDEATPDEVEQAAAELEQEIGYSENLSKDGLTKVLRRAVDLARKNGTELPEEVQQKLKLLDELSAEREKSQESQQFDEEFQAYVPELKKQYPNASDAMLEEAKQELDKLAHSKQHAEHDLDYIVFKNKERFDTILTAAPGSRSAEQGRRYGSEPSFEQTDSEENLPDIEDLTPEIMEHREQQSMHERSSNNKDYRVRGPVR